MLPVLHFRSAICIDISLTQLFKSVAAYTSLHFDDTGEMLILARTDDTLQLYNTTAGAYARELKSFKYGCALARFTHSPTSLIYASTKVDDAIRYLGTHDNNYIRYFKGHTNRVTSLSMSPSDDRFLSSSMDNTVKMWDLRSANAQGNLNLHAPYLTSYDPSATVIAIGSPPAQSILLYDLRNYDKPPFATFELEDIEKRFTPYGQRPMEGWTKMEFSNNGQYLLVGTTGGGHYLLDAFDGSLKAYLRRPSGPTGRTAPGDTIPSTDNLGQGDVCFTPDGRYIIGGNGSSHGLLVWDSEGERQPNKVLEPISELPATKPASVVGYNPRHNLVASADKDVMLWLPDPDLA